MPTRKNTRPAITPLNPPDVPVERKQRAMAGERPPEDQAAFISADDTDSFGVLTETALYEGELSARAPSTFITDYGESLELVAETYGDELPDEIEDELALFNADREIVDQLYSPDLPASLRLGLSDHPSLELLTELELRAEETADPMEAAEEGYTYVPPIDPPIVPGYPGTTADFEVASGLGVSALAEPYDEAHHSGFMFAEDEITARVREALRADSSTCQYAGTVEIETDGSVVILRGVVDDLLDADNLVAVASYVEGVAEVVDELSIRGMEEPSEGRNVGK